MRGCVRRWRFALIHPSVGVLVLSQYVELGLALELLADSAEGVGYLLKDRFGMSTSSSPRFAALPMAVRPSTRSSSRHCCLVNAPTILLAEADAA